MLRFPWGTSRVMDCSGAKHGSDPHVMGSCHTNIKCVCEVPNDVRYRNFTFLLGLKEYPVMTAEMRVTVS